MSNRYYEFKVLKERPVDRLWHATWRYSVLVLYYLFILFVAFMLGATLYTVGCQRASAANPFCGKVTAITDGDTLKVMREGRAVRIRVYGIDAPETSQPFGYKAKQYASDLAFDRTVLMTVRETDRYGRLIAEIILPGGRNLGHEMVKAGLAWWYKYFAPMESELGNLEHEARHFRRGLWETENPVAPWEWRKSREGKKQ